ncbi:MAG TPA: 2-dehydropantoate 2-reductase [Chloroflexota bacterium]|jgi:2-dehydropantoate 2-reductase|nr:2-dehydropantoate 2-reductase [Chloroflexota bacterium]
MTQSLAIVGAGALGQAFAAHLVAAGNDAVLVGTPRSAAALLDAGRICLTGASETEVPVAPPPGRSGAATVISSAVELPQDAGVLFTTKAHQLAEACTAVRESRAVAWVAGVQNGLLKDDILVAAFGAERVVGMATIYSAGRRAGGEVAVSSLGRTYVGELDGSASERSTRLAQMLCAAGIPTEHEQDIRSVTWSKACNAAGVFGVSVLTRTTGAELLGDPDLLRAYLSLVRETAAIASANGVVLGDYFGFPIKTFVERTDEESVAARGPLPPPRAPRLFPSMTQDLRAGRSLEAEEIFGDLVERADRAEIAVPRLRFVRDLSRGIVRLREQGTALE